MESERPSQKKPPNASGSAASSSQWKWKRGTNFRYSTDGVLRRAK